MHDIGNEEGIRDAGLSARQKSLSANGATANSGTNNQIGEKIEQQREREKLVSSQIALFPTFVDKAALTAADIRKANVLPDERGLCVNSNSNVTLEIHADIVEHEKHHDV